ncbi:MAG: hypothetical protein QOE36_2030 [Gaiellaceae bacterium]|nr:hypothetical protein [Gaiellaceae bacterium]
MWIWLVPITVVGGLLVLFLLLAVLSRLRGGRYLRPVVTTLTKVPLFRKGITKASTAALERQNPALASAIRKLERSGALNDPRRAQAALSRLTPTERRAYMEAAGEQGAVPEAMNRQQRRQMAKARAQSQRPR